MNNAIPHNYSRQSYISPITRCSFYFPDPGVDSNLARAEINGKTTFIAAIKKTSTGVDAYITVPDGMTPTHYFNEEESVDPPTVNAHLTYHGSSKKSKITGEIHLVNQGNNSLSSMRNRLEAPVSKSSNLELYPLPICRLELNKNAGLVTPKKRVHNFFSLTTPNAFFNTIEIYLAKNGFLNSIAGANMRVPELLASIFVHTNMLTFTRDRLQRRPGLFPQCIALQIKNFELLILATHEYANSEYVTNRLHYFHTSNYFSKLMNRKYSTYEGGWFVDQKSQTSFKSDEDYLFSLLPRFNRNKKTPI